MLDAVCDRPSQEPAPESSETATRLPPKGAIKTGVIWIAAGFGATQVLRFGSSVIMAHLLYPKAFGLFALTYAFLVGLHLFSDLGIRLSIIQNPRGDERRFLDTAWTIQILRGFLIWGASLAIAWPAAFWRPEPEPELLWLLPTVAFTAVIEGFASTNLHGLYRHLEQRTIVVIDLLSTISSMATMIVWAKLHGGLGALAAGPLAGSLVQFAASYLLPGPGNRLRWDRRSAHELVHFGRWIFVSTVLTFLADQSDRLVVSMISISLLGVYHLAAQIANVPLILMGTVSRQVIMPLYSRMLDAGQSVEEVLRLIQVRAGASVSLLIGGLIAAGPSLIRCLYDARYEQATWILPLLGVAIMFNIFDNNASSLLIARGNPKIYALSNAIKVVCLTIFIPLGTWFDGVRGLIFSLIIGEIGRYACTGLALRRRGLPIFKRDLCWAAFALVLGATGNYFANLLVDVPATGRDRPLLMLRMAAGGGTVLAIWAVAVVSVWKIGWFKSREKESPNMAQAA